MTDTDSGYVLELFNQKQVALRWGISRSLYARGVKTGFINNVQAPAFVKRGSNYLVNQLEIEKYFARIEKFKETYLTYDELGKELRWDHYDKVSGCLNGRKMLAHHGHYLKIQAPPAYYFIHNRKKYFHVVDVEIMCQAVTKSILNKLTPADGLDRKTGLYLPRYLMPLDKEYESQYKEQTMQLISRWRFERLRDEHHPGQLSFDHLLEE